VPVVVVVAFLVVMVIILPAHYVTIDRFLSCGQRPGCCTSRSAAAAATRR